MTRIAALFIVIGLSMVAARTQAIDETKIVDLSYSFGADTIYWPTAKPFSLSQVSHQHTAGGYFYAANDFCTAEHGGTHMDAPIHFAEGKATTDQVPVGAGIGPLVRIDVSRQAAADPDYRLTVEDLLAWEKDHGRVPAGAIVVMFSDWGKRWPDRKRYLGTDQPGDTANLHFPAFSKEAVAFYCASASSTPSASTHRASITDRRRTSSSTRRSTGQTSRALKISPTSTACRRAVRR